MALWCTQTRRSLPTCVYPFQPESGFILNLKLLSSDYFIRSSVYAHMAQFPDFEAEERASAAAPPPLVLLLLHDLSTHGGLFLACQAF